MLGSGIPLQLAERLFWERAARRETARYAGPRGHGTRPRHRL